MKKILLFIVTCITSTTLPMRHTEATRTAVGSAIGAGIGGTLGYRAAEYLGVEPRQATAVGAGFGTLAGFYWGRSGATRRAYLNQVAELRREATEKEIQSKSDALSKNAKRLLTQIAKKQKTLALTIEEFLNEKNLDLETLKNLVHKKNQKISTLKTELNAAMDEDPESPKGRRKK